MSVELTVSNAELRSARETMHKLGTMLDELESGQAKKFVVTQQNRMRGVLLSLEEYARLTDEVARLRRDAPVD
jgi:PHD/YefM family antitoxin component YafN of YafNO toxin-antitoxin module